MVDLIKLQQLPILPQEQYYIYVIENSDGITNKIKIGITHNPYQRLSSLSGSNGGGSVITKYIVSPPTFLYSIEGTCHNHFDRYRIQGTEWFKGITIDEAAEYVRSLFSSKGYKTCNELRKSIVEKEKEKEKLKEENKLLEDKSDEKKYKKEKK